MSSTEKFTCFEFIESKDFIEVLIGSDLGSLFQAKFDISKEVFEQFIARNQDKYMSLIDSGEIPIRKSKFNSRIRSINRISKDEYIIGCRNGDLILYILEKNESIFLKRGETNVDRIWCIIVLRETAFITSGNYGRLILYTKQKDKWVEERLLGHQDAIFCLGKVNDTQFTTNDYRGNNYLWTINKNFVITNEKMERSIGNMQNVTEITNTSFSMINVDGRIFLFEHSWGQYRKMIDFSLASGRGNDIKFKHPNLVCGTNSELIFINPESLESSEIRYLECLQLRISKGLIFFLSSHNLHYTLEAKAELHENQTIFKYTKIGLIGHTGVGNRLFVII